jgi:hypothetical protein
MGNRNQMVPLLLYCDRKLDALKFSINWLSSDTPHQGGCDFALIKPGQIDPNCPEGSKVAKEIAKGYHDGAQLCDGALAAFLVFGDCPLARRFLKKSAAANRHILSRVLAKTKIPSAPYLNVSCSLSLNYIMFHSRFPPWTSGSERTRSCARLPLHVPANME